MFLYNPKKEKIIMILLLYGSMEALDVPPY
jgi:hypothetical protein